MHGELKQGHSAPLPMPIGGGGQVAVHMIEFSPLDFDVELFARHGIVAPPEIVRSVRKRQAEFFHGRLAARRALEPLGLGLELAQIGIGQSRQPLWPAGIIGSITHNGRYAAAVALDGARHVNSAGIGIDIETVVAASMQDVLLATAVSGTELDYLRGLATALDLNTLLSLVFSAKESFFKAAFNMVGRYFDFDAIVLVHMDTQQRLMRFRVEQTLCRELAGGAFHEVHFTLVDAETVLTSCHLPRIR